MKEGVAVPLLFRVALTSDTKDYLKQHKTRRLWTMPVRQAVAVAQGRAPEPVQYHGKQKRERVDKDGDALMVHRSLAVISRCVAGCTLPLHFAL
jgi:hypothetical protein